MLLLDTNILIYATKPGYELLVEYIQRHQKFISVSVISKLEVFGTPKLFDYQKKYLVELFSSAQILHVTIEIADIAIELRQHITITLPDALIAATALFHGSTLVTRNVADFAKIKMLDVIDPILL